VIDFDATFPAFHFPWRGKADSGGFPHAATMAHWPYLIPRPLSYRSRPGVVAHAPGREVVRSALSQNRHNDHKQHQQHQREGDQDTKNYDRVQIGRGFR
jgi:hypothetical protein